MSLKIKTPKSILFITTDYPPEIGGLQTYSQRILEVLGDQLIAHILIIRRHKNTQMVEEKNLGPNSTIIYSGSKISFMLKGFWNVLHLKGKYRLRVQLHMQWSTAIPSLVLKLLGWPSRYLILIHGQELISHSPFIRVLQKYLFQNADHVIAGSRFTQKLYQDLKISPKQALFLLYGSPLSPPTVMRKLPSQNTLTNRLQLLCMHRLVFRKGTELLINALAKMKNLNWELHIIGSGPEKENLRRQVQEADLISKIHFINEVSENEKIAWLLKSDLLILPSLPPQNNNHIEGLGLSLLEAQSLGTPVLAARTGGIPEALHEGVTGQLFKAGDANDLQAKLENLYRHPEVLQSFAEQGPQWIRDNFSWEKSLAELKILLDASLGT